MNNIAIFPGCQPIAVRGTSYGGHVTGAFHDLPVTIHPAVKGRAWAEIEGTATIQDFSGADVSADDFEIISIEVPDMDGGHDISVTVKTDPAAFAVLKAGIDRDKLAEALARIEREGQRDMDT